MYYVSWTAATLETRKHLKQLRWIKPRLIVFKPGLSWKMEMFGYHVREDYTSVCVVLFPKPWPTGKREDCVFRFVCELYFWSWLMPLDVAFCLENCIEHTRHNPFKHIYTCIHNNTASATLKGSFFSQAKKTSFRVHFVFPYWFWLAFISARPLKSILFSVYISLCEWVNSPNRGALWGKEKQGLITFVCQRGGDAQLH